MQTFIINGRHYCSSHRHAFTVLAAANMHTAVASRYCSPVGFTAGFSQTGGNVFSGGLINEAVLNIKPVRRLFQFLAHLWDLLEFSAASFPSVNPSSIFTR